MGPAAVPRQFPIRDFFSNPERAYFRLSDDGGTLGFMQPVAPEGGGQRRLNVFVQKLEGSRLVGEPRKLTSETARDITIYYWKGSNRILYVKDFGGGIRRPATVETDSPMYKGYKSVMLYSQLKRRELKDEVFTLTNLPRIEDLRK